MLQERILMKVAITLMLAFSRQIADITQVYLLFSFEPRRREGRAYED